MTNPEKTPALNYRKDKLVESLTEVPIEMIIQTLDCELIKLLELNIEAITGLNLGMLETDEAVPNVHSKVKALMINIFHDLRKQFIYIVKDKDSLSEIRIFETNNPDLLLTSVHNQEQNIIQLARYDNLQVAGEWFSVGLFRNKLMPYQYQLRFYICID